MIAAVLLAACRPGRDDLPDAPDDHSAATGDGCPRLDWVVRLQGPIEDAVDHVLPTPEGDVIIAGSTTGGIPVGTGPEVLALGQGFRDGFVARLAPDGQVRWSHVIGGIGADQVYNVQLHGDELWLAGDVEGPLRIDGEPQDQVSVDLGLDAWGMALDASTGIVRDLRRLVWPGGQMGSAFAIDQNGGRVLTGSAYAGAFGFAGLEVPGTPGSSDAAAFLAKWNSRGEEQWATLFSPERGVATGDALRVDSSPPLWAAFLIDDQPIAWSGGVHPPLPPTSLTHHTVLTYDPDTGQIGPTTFDPTVGSFPFRVDVTAAGLQWFGYGTAPSWIDGDGESHVVHDGSAFVAPGMRRGIGPTGGVTSVWWENTGVRYFYGGDETGDGRRVVTGLGPGNTGSTATFGAETPHEVTLEGSGHEPDGFVALYDPGNEFRCAWGLGGWSSQIVRDAAFDGEGGFVVVGEFNTELLLRSSDEETLVHLEEGPGVDGFVIRFAPPTPP